MGVADRAGCCRLGRHVLWLVRVPEAEAPKTRAARWIGWSVIRLSRHRPFGEHHTRGAAHRPGGARNDIEREREQGAKDLGLTDTEFAFYNILFAEITKSRGDESLDDDAYDTLKEVVQSLVTMLDEASQIVDFFRKLDEQKTVKKSIKRMILKHYDLSLVKPVTDRFMELAQVKFR